MRRLAWLAFAVALLLGWIGDRGIARTPPTRGGYLVLAADFHVHSFPGDGGLAPWDIAHEARRRRLDVIALTNHNATWSWRLTRALGWNALTPGVLMLPGDEVTGVGFHVAAVGIDRPVSWRGTIEDVAAAVHREGGVAVGAHPAGTYRAAFTASAMRALDGIEAAHPEMFESDERYEEFLDIYRAAVAAHPGIAAIGSSDFHTCSPVGVCRTYVFVRVANAADVLEAIRAGRTVACAGDKDGKGLAYGPPALAALVRDDCRVDSNVPPLGNVAAAHAGAYLAWLSVLVLVLVGTDEHVLTLT